MYNQYKVSCIPTELGVKISILCIKSRDLQITINSPNQEVARYDCHSRGYVSKKKYNHRNWSSAKLTYFSDKQEPVVY
jgi:hypothetical protein